MKIATKIISGYGILIALMVCLLVHQVYTIDRMQTIVTRQSEVNVEAAVIALKMRSDMEQVGEFTRKSFVLTDSAPYRKLLQEYRQAYESGLNSIQKVASNPKVNAEIQRLRQLWAHFSEELVRSQSDTGGKRQPISDELAAQIEGLRTQTGSVYEAAIAGIKEEVKAADRTSRMAESISWIVAAAALLLSSLVSLLIVQSISVPLRQLTQGTRAITEGKFYYRLNSTRRDEFGQLAKDFNSMTHRLDELDQMKKDFVAHVSHELKVPIASQQETIQLLLEQIPGPINDKQKRLLELNLGSCQRLSTMIGNLLDVSRMEAGVMEYELKSHDLTALVRNAAAEFQQHGGAHDSAIALDVPDHAVMIDCDADRITQVLRNLLSNAIKFSRGKDIRVRIATAPEIPAGMPVSWREKVPPPPDGKIVALVAVTDSGPGVPDQHKEKIFEKFHQVRQGKKITGQGAGLGLAISRTIAEAHRGALWVEDNPEGGSVFYLLIPPGETAGQVSYRASTPL